MTHPLEGGPNLQKVMFAARAAHVYITQCLVSQLWAKTDLLVESSTMRIE